MHRSRNPSTRFRFQSELRLLNEKICKHQSTIKRCSVRFFYSPPPFVAFAVVFFFFFFWRESKGKEKKCLGPVLARKYQLDRYEYIGGGQTNPNGKFAQLLAFSESLLVPQSRSSFVPELAPQGHDSHCGSKQPPRARRGALMLPRKQIDFGIAPP